MFNMLDLEATTVPNRYRQALQQIITCAENHSDLGVQKVVLFGSLSRSTITCQSDIDICVVFFDEVDLHSCQVALFKAKLRICADIDVDVVFCTETTFANSSERLFAEIRRDGISLLTK